MTANAGKGADGKPGQRSTGSDAKGGRTRKKASAAKQPSDEVTVRTDAKDDTDGSASDEAEKTVIDKAGKNNEETVRDVTPPEPEADNDATVIDALPSSSSSASEDESNRTATFGLPKDGASDRAKKDGSGTSKRAIEPSSRDDAGKKPQESGESLPTSGRGAGMGSTTPRSYGSDTGAGTPSYSSSGSLSSAAMPGGGPGTGSGAGAAAIEAGSRTGKLTGALRKSDKPGRKAPRKAHLQVARFEPWSVMKFSFIMSLVCFLVLFVAVAVLYVILSWLGVFDALSGTIRDLTSNDQGKSGSLNPASWFSAARILGYTALIGTLNVLLITALATVWSVIYNMAADLVGGVEVTLKEADQ
jgi:Transmembrane domain of unknown function (DUF3566)